MSDRGNCKLAIFGHPPAFSGKLFVGLPNIGNRERLFRRIDSVLDNRRLTNNGPFVQELELKVAELTGVKHCVAVCNATIGIQIAAKASGLHGEVIVPAFTFIATAHALQWIGLTPVFCDIDPDTHNIDPALIEAKITPLTSGIMGVHIWGRACNIPALRAISDQHDLVLLFDAAHAFGCSYQHTMIGNFGEAEIFSFHATKFLSTLEGGAVVTNDDDLAQEMRMMRNFGFIDNGMSYTQGTNGKMDEFSAAFGINMLEDIETIIEANRATYRQYEQDLKDVPGIRFVHHPESEKSNYQYVILEIDETKTDITRDEIIEILQAENIMARRYFHPGCHRMGSYLDQSVSTNLSLPVTEKLTERVLALPTGLSVGPANAHKIGGILQYLIENGPSVARQYRNQRGR